MEVTAYYIIPGSNRLPALAARFRPLFVSEFIRRQLQISHQSEQCYRGRGSRHRWRREIRSVGGKRA